MLNRKDHKVVGLVLEMLESINSTGSDLYIDVKLKSPEGHMTIDFTDEYGDWIYEVNVE